MKKAPYVVLLLVFLLCYAGTGTDYLGDTTSYAKDAALHAQRAPAPFFEFGHLLWRPWAYAGLSLFGGWYTRLYGDGPQQAAIRFLILTNLVCSALALCVLYSLARRVSGVWVATGVAFAVSCSAPFLKYSHAGSSYIPALLGSLVALSLLLEAAGAPERNLSRALLGGAAFALACALWFPFCFTGLGFVLALFARPSHDSAHAAGSHSSRYRLLAAFLCSLAATFLMVLAMGAAAEHIRSIRDASRWIAESGHGWSQSNNALRAITGAARSTWDFAGDTILLKRWLFADPYNPVHVRAVAFSMGWKLALFYGGIAAALWALWKQRRDLFLALSGAALPLLVFAIVLFEPSSPERFLPLLGFMTLAFAVALDRFRRNRLAALFVSILLAAAVLYNLAEASSLWGARLADTRMRTQALVENVQPGALVFVVTFADALYEVRTVYPLDQTLASSRFRVDDVAEIASVRLLRWRAEFAEKTLAEWAAGHEVWLSERLLAPRPAPQWLWVEGDDRRIHWSEFPAAFSPFEYDAKVLPGRDGFLRLARNQRNEDRLQRTIASAGPP